jgi:hypothetical protein
MLFLKDDPGARRTPATIERPGLGPGGAKIRCPKCGWEPSRSDQWMCLCLHVWNTFETGGVCPACRRQWEETQCLRCQGWSAHDDWYVDEPDRAP